MKDKFEVDLGTYLVYPFLINFRFKSLNKYHNKENLFYLKDIIEKKYHFTKISDDLTLLFFKKDDCFAAPIFIDHHFFFLNKKLKNRLNLLDNLKISTFIYLKKSKTNNFEEINDLKKRIIFFNNIENINNYLISKLISKKELKLIKIDFINHHFKDLIQKKIVRLL
jgi:hypothetical protein